MSAAPTPSPLCDGGCGTPLVLAGANAMLVGRCAPCVKRIALAARGSFRDNCRTGSGLVSNGRTVATLDRCKCGGPIFTAREIAEGCCVDCSIVAQRAIADELQRDHDAACEAVEAGIELSVASAGGGR